MPAVYKFESSTGQATEIRAGSYAEASTEAATLGAYRFAGQVIPARPRGRLMTALMWLTLFMFTVAAAGGGYSSHIEHRLFPLLVMLTFYFAIPMGLLLALKTNHELGHVVAIKIAPKTALGRRRRVNGIGLWLLTGLHVVVWGRGKLQFFRRNHAYVSASIPAFDPKARLWVALGGPLATLIVGILCIVGAISWAALTCTFTQLVHGFDESLRLSLLGEFRFAPGFGPSLLIVYGIFGIGDYLDNMRSVVVKDGTATAHSDGYHVARARLLLTQEARP